MAVALVGPTASGKSQTALDVVRTVRASRVAVGTIVGAAGDGATVGGDVELVSVDSMSVYRGMDIGTAKPRPEVRAEVRYHLVDLVDPDEEFTVTQFQAAAADVLAGIAERGNRAVLVGGTGLYLRSVIDDLEFPGRFPGVAAGLTAELDRSGPVGSAAREAGLAGLHARLGLLDPVAAARIEPGNERRLVRALEVTIGAGRPFSGFGPGLERYPPTRFALVGIGPDPDADGRRIADRRIADRFARMMDEGLLDEVRRLAARPGGLSRTARQALGYRELLTHVEAGVPLDEAVDEAVRRTKQFARRQWAWFRRDPRIEWVGADGDPVAAVVSRLDGHADGVYR
ncbi:MAG: tRNA (adenosine(37)-N6)-dimethylallyltransferase MiaA [Acidimicrobiales bacterium]